MKLIDKLETVNNSICSKVEELNNATDVAEASKLVEELNNLKAEKLTLENQLETGDKISMTQNYLETKNAMKDFAEIVKNSANKKEARNAWNLKLQENGITITDEGNYLPKRLELELQTVLTKANAVFPIFKTTNNGALLVSRELTSEDEAQVHKRGEQKTYQSASLKVSAVDPQMIYKRQSLDEIDKRKLSNFTEIYETITAELAQRIIDKIVDLALVEGEAKDGGTGTADEENGFVAILKETDENKVAHVDGSKDLVAALEDAADIVDYPGKKYLIVTRQQKRAILDALRKKFPNTTYRNNNKDIAEDLGVDELIVYRGTKAIKPTVIAEGAYHVDMQKLEKIEQFKLDTNENDILVETLATGRPVAFGGIAVVDLA